MMQYISLITEIKNTLKAFKATGNEHCHLSSILSRSADAIEELSAFRNQITDGHLYCMRDGELYVLNVSIPNGAKTIKLPKIEFDEQAKDGGT